MAVCLLDVRRFFPHDRDAKGGRGKDRGKDKGKGQGKGKAKGEGQGKGKGKAKGEGEDEGMITGNMASCQQAMHEIYSLWNWVGGFFMLNVG